MLDGDLCGGGERPFGFSRFSTYLFNVNGEEISFPVILKGDSDFQDLHKMFVYIRDRY
jgi:hypothetical protein